MKKIFKLIVTLPLLTPGSSLWAEPALFTTASMTPDTALKLALATLQDCRKKNFQISVAVLDRNGVTQVIIRDRYAPAVTPDVAKNKARTALNLVNDTIDAIEGTSAGSEAAGLRNINGFVIVAGGVLVKAAGKLVGAIGVSGAPGGRADDSCARTGIEAISDLLNF
ncbi:MAG: heme-binding protein [Gammaproteobacteria bacterium]|nr:heme-binding protein [Gammaproteobacteria bacterium]